MSKKGLRVNDNPKLLDEVVNLVDSPNILLCNFDKKFLSIPKEILILTMETHQNISQLLMIKMKLPMNF